MARITTKRTLYINNTQMSENDIVFLPYEDIEKLH